MVKNVHHRTLPFCGAQIIFRLQSAAAFTADTHRSVNGAIDQSQELIPIFIERPL